MEENSEKSLIDICDEYLSKHPLSVEILHYDNFDQVTIDAVIMCLHLEAKQRSLQFRDIATKFILESISYIISDKNDHSELNPKFLMALMSKISALDSLNHYEIQQHINSFPKLLPMQLIIKLDQLGIISFTNFFQNGIDSPKKVAGWVRCILQLACEAEEDNDINTLQAVVTGIVGIGFGKLPPEIQCSITGQTSKTSVLMINSITRKIWDFLWENPDAKVQIFDTPEDLRYMYCDAEAIRCCYLEQIAFLFSYKPDIKASQAIASQHEWTYFKSPENITNFIMQLLLPLDVEKLLDKIGEILIRYEINWKTMLMVISTIQVCFANGNKLVKGMINNLIQKGMESMQRELILASTLLARQINAEASNSGVYGAWFASIVTPSTITTKQFTFLMEFLSRIVCHEPFWVLVAHRNHPPFVPSVDNCRTLWSDYIALVRTRIEDLKLQIPAEKIIEEDSTIIKEVEAAIASFEKTGRIPNSVIEAAIFKKPYFTGKFLPVLLKPRKVPAAIDVREEFIDELRRSEKLPLAQYEIYVNACKELEKVSDVDMDWKTSDGSPDFKSLMDRIADNAKETSKAMQLITKLSTLISETLPKPERTVPLIDFSPDLLESDRKENSQSWEIVDSWISALDKALEVAESIQWMSRYFHVLCPYANLMQSLYLLIYQVISQRNQSEKIRCFGRLLCLLNLNSHLLIPVRYGSFQGDIIQLIFSPKSNILTNSESMMFAIQILYHAVTDAKALKVFDSIPQVLGAYVWLCRRLSYSQKSSECHDFTKLSLDSEVLNAEKMDVKDWLRFEVNVRADQDVLKMAERSGYLRYVLEEVYANVGQTELASSALEAVIDCSLENPSGFINCSADVLLLIQSSFNSAEDTGPSDPWLLKLWQNYHKTNGENVDPVVWSLMCTLPAYLLCRNSPEHPPTESSLKMFSKLIEGRWRNSMMEGAWFPKHVTAHIIRATDDNRLIGAVPCLQFSAQIHGIRASLQKSGYWRKLENSLEIFHPISWRAKNRSAFVWSGDIETDILATQLMLLALTAQFEKNLDQEWPWFVKQLGSNILRNPALLDGWKISSWMNEDYVLPWGKLLPDKMLKLLAIVMLRVLIFWSSTLRTTDVQLALKLLEGVLAAYNHWIQVSNSCIDTVSTPTDTNSSSFAAENLLEFATLGKLNRDVKQIIQEMPLRAVKQFQQSPKFKSLDSDFQAVFRQRNV